MIKHVLPVLCCPLILGSVLTGVLTGVLLPASAQADTAEQSVNPEDAPESLATSTNLRSLDEEVLKDFLGNALACEVAGVLQTTLNLASVYTLAGNGCERVTDQALLDDDGELGALYSDPQCFNTFDYSGQSVDEYCAYVLDPEALGNAAANRNSLQKWTVSPGTRFDIGALPLKGRTQPFTQRVSYKQVNTVQGVCELEMRIHTTSPDALRTAAEVGSTAQLKPLIAFHGGSWQRRSSGALGIESIATVFSNAGYVVFAPFYRLIDTDEGSIECNDASLTDVLDDASDAVDWVQDNAWRYGAQGKPVLFGQSAGGHMAAVMAMERPDDVAATVAFYAPTDFTAFAQNIIDGQIDSEIGRSILETVVGQTLETLNVNVPLIQRNTLPKRIVDSDEPVPPFFLLHGKNDTVLPFNQSVRLCDALAGNLDNGPAAQTVAGFSLDPFKQVVMCDANGSELHLITEGKHALDLCLAKGVCLAGSPISARKTSDSVQRLLEWLVEIDGSENGELLTDDSTTGNNMVSTSTSSGALSWFGLLIVSLMLARYYGSARPYS